MDLLITKLDQPKMEKAFFIPLVIPELFSI